MKNNIESKTKQIFFFRGYIYLLKEICIFKKNKIKSSNIILLLLTSIMLIIVIPSILSTGAFLIFKSEIISNILEGLFRCVILTGMLSLMKYVKPCRDYLKKLVKRDKSGIKDIFFIMSSYIILFFLLSICLWNLNFLQGLIIRSCIIFLSVGIIYEINKNYKFIKLKRINEPLVKMLWLIVYGKGIPYEN